MNCPYCGRQNPADAEYCVSCGYPLPVGDESGQGKGRVRQVSAALGRGLRTAAIALLVPLSLFVFGYAWYKIHFWAASRARQKVYTSGRMQTPTLEETTLTDGRSGHRLTFFGEDGDSVYIEQLRQSYLIVGGKVEILIADSEWFDNLPNDIDRAEITLLPVLLREDGGQENLPGISFEVDTPTSPLELINPKQQRTTVLSAIYQLEMKVVPGSTVLVDGSDVTDMVDVLGNLSVNVAVYPQGDNPISILVRTPRHKETRADIVLYRERTDIDIELSIYTSRSSARKTMAVSGAVDPTAKLVVDSPHVPDSLTVGEDGSFTFYAEFEEIGTNTVTFHAEKAGCQNAVISFDVNYLPTLPEYAKDPWRIIENYDNMLRMYEQWKGRVFRCRGTAVKVLDDRVFIMDVGDGYLLAIENATSVQVKEGGVYDFYADLNGLYDSTDGNIPYLIARYEKIDL